MRKQSNRRILRAFLPLTLLFGVWVAAGCAGESTARADSESRIEYSVVDEWRIPNGGYGRVIVVQPTYRDEQLLRALGEQLRGEHRNDRHAFIEIFDDTRAANMRQAATEERLNQQDLAFHDYHKIGFYQKNSVSGHHVLVMALDGVEGEFVEVKYPRP
jgi:hypothetical protein